MPHEPNDRGSSPPDANEQALEALLKEHRAAVLGAMPASGAARGEVEQRYEALVAGVQDVVASLRYLQQYAEHVDHVVWVSDNSLRDLLFVNRAYELIWGRPVADLLADPASHLESVHPDDRDRVRAAIERHRAGEAAETTYRILRPDGEVRWIRDRAFPIRDGDGRVYRVAGVAEDVTERRREEARRRLLERELDHRVRNGLATAIALAEQTAAGATSIAEFLPAFTARLRGLATAHELLDADAQTSVALATLARGLIAPYAGDADRLRLDGPPRRIPAAVAPPLALVLHELATNALKHGALGRPEGRVTIAWSEATDPIELTWSEEGGPPCRPETREGFGRRLIRGLVEHQLGGRVETDHPPEGLRVRLIVPLRR